MKDNFKFYSRQGLWSLFLICAFPLHFWTIILVFNDVEWLANRSDIWDSIGVASYGLVFAFVESLFLFLAAALLGLLIPLKWSVERRVALMSVLVFILAAWAMAAQFYFFIGTPFPVNWLMFFASVSRPLVFLYVTAFALILPTVLIPTWLVLKYEKPLMFVSVTLEKISLLTAFYLVFDIFGLSVLALRNL
jgi:hypothetical protein